VADIVDRFPNADGPSLTAVQKRDWIRTPSGEVVDLPPLRLALIAKLQRLVPELDFHPVHDVTATESGFALLIYMNRLDDAGGQINEYDAETNGDIIRIMRNIDATNRDYIHPPSDTDQDEEGEEEYDPEDEPL
jgi:hypothetical protein